MSTSSGASSSPPSSAAVAAIALVADDSAPVAPLPAKTAAALHDAHENHDHDEDDSETAPPIALANGEHGHDATATPALALDMATASLALENLTNLPDDLHIVLRLVLDNDALLLHLAMQAYLHASHSLLLADWLAQSNPEHVHALLAHAAPVPLDALPAPVDARTSPPPIASATAVCPPVSAADLHGYCADLASPFFAQRLEAALVHGIAYAATANSSNRDDPWVHWHSNFPGQISLWTSSATPPGAPPTSSTRLLHPPRAAGLAAVGASSLTIRYVDVDPVRADRTYKAGMLETRVGTAFVEDVSLDTDDEHEHGDDDAALGLDDMRADARYDPAAHGGTKLHPLAQFERVTRRDPVTGPLMRSFVGSIAYNVHVPLDHIVRVTLLRPVPRKASSDANAHHDPDAASTDDDSEEEEDDEDDSGQEILVFETARAPSFSVQALCPLSKHHYLAECDDWTGGMARAARRWMIVAD
ncbi:hypothetical protein AMAG_11818 [Allomyces macrogynus ATCC 38327]|uniref:Uncharacterized protein n=1 Tax=Allomyces macrogynus (strain ATCC 38327) TaxID=578462 RepID=A0A0L0SXX8_ALLM3|nr:hypothetical protein AMAG_11818 [Allomyces macrogynus ATCC 38327]|eukprot:KNE67351.1 hypothetical protein AMAG_11818 [Allomyces macrogynus ATCC 38327]